MSYNIPAGSKNIFNFFGQVDKIIPGPGIQVSPPEGEGDVTVSLNSTSFVSSLENDLTIPGAQILEGAPGPQTGALKLKSVNSSDGSITVADHAFDIDIVANFPVTSVDNDPNLGAHLVENSTGAVVIKNLLPGVGVTLSESPIAITINATGGTGITSIADTAGASNKLIVSSPITTTGTIRGLSAGTGITISSDAEHP